MKRDYSIIKRNKLTQREAGKKIAIHEAGHAAAIYFGNQQKGLPEIQFQITIKTVSCGLRSPYFAGRAYEKYSAMIEGGRFIQSLPLSVEGMLNKGSAIIQPIDYERALEADIFNLLVGPLAEAKYIALRDGEIISHQLINFNALHHYGGLDDVETVNKYLKHFIKSESAREKKLADLFLAAYYFVNDQAYWLAICELANYILASNRSIIEFDAIIAVLEKSIQR